MNLVWAGGPVAALLMGFNHRNKDGFAYQAGKRLAYSLPVFLSFAITQGIVPLLFLQLMYGPAYYTSSVLMAWPWLSVLAILLGAYYLLYIFKLKESAFGSKSVALLWLAFGLFTGIAFLFVNNMTLMLSPERWPTLAQGGVDGFALNLSDPQLILRYLHFMIGAFAVTGLGMGCFGIYYDHCNKPYSQWWIRNGAGLFLGATLLEFLTGLWFMLSLPKVAKAAYMGHDIVATSVFGVSTVMSVIALLGALMAWRSGSLRSMQVTVGAGLLSVLGMVVMRHLLRVMILHPILKPEQIPVSTQWDLLIVFVISTVLLAGYLIWLSRLVYSAFENPPADASAVSVSGIV